ncbi:MULTISPECIES: hypothetical protein [unclassified Streptomyces]|uniref:hypothetical protein n=1 Tax=unclassified Streptomyces TaxID=2593676 RepID=UPI000361CAA5|nr:MULTISPECIES: hypothetical protein [unclassified Streptomyces]MYT31618.1 hypothetical protein [Streptomyces sp. SID8354]
MRVDPTDPDTFEDATEAPAADPFDVEAPEADAAEQHTDLAPQRDEKVTGGDYSANEADRAEQARVVELNEDEYR